MMDIHSKHCGSNPDSSDEEPVEDIKQHSNQDKKASQGKPSMSLSVGNTTYYRPPRQWPKLQESGQKSSLSRSYHPAQTGFDPASGFGANRSVLQKGIESIVDKGLFESRVQQSDVPVVALFGPPGLGAVRQTQEALLEVAGPDSVLSDKVRLVLVNTDVAGALASQYSITRVPSILWFNPAGDKSGNKPVKPSSDRLVTAQDVTQLRRFFNRRLQTPS